MFTTFLYIDYLFFFSRSSSHPILEFWYFGPFRIVISKQVCDTYNHFSINFKDFKTAFLTCTLPCFMLQKPENRLRCNTFSRFWEIYKNMFKISWNQINYLNRPKVKINWFMLDIKMQSIWLQKLFNDFKLTSKRNC